MMHERGTDYLVTGDSTDPFLPKLLDGINRAVSIDLAVAFIKVTGLKLLFPALKDAVTSGAQAWLRAGRYEPVDVNYLNCMA